MHPSRITALALAGSALVAVVLYGSHQASVGWNSDKTQFTLPNQWRITPAGTRVSLPGDFPGNVVFIDDHRALVNTSGYHDHSLSLVDCRSGRLISKVDLKQAWVGLAFDGSSVYLGGGGSEGTSEKPDVRRYKVDGGNLVESAPLNLPDLNKGERFVSGILPTPGGLVVLNAQTDEVFLIGPDDKIKARKRVGYRPYAAAISPDGSTIAVSEWGDKSVSLLEAATLQPMRRISVGAMPSSLTYDKKGRLFVSESGSNTVAVIQGTALQRVTVSIDPLHPVGPTPSALAVSPDQKRLYVTLSGDNAVAVIDISGARPLLIGHIPTERYPSAAAVSASGLLAVGTAKGFYGPNAGKEVKLEGAQIRGKKEGVPFRYVLQQLEGSVAVMESPTSKDLAKLTKQARTNLPEGLRGLDLPKAEVAARLKAIKNIKHVVFVIKENRTYDQVFGDIPAGNGDPSLTLFGKKITPNQHKLAGDFVLMDNLYTDGECSQVGHQWTTAAYASDYTEKATMLGYSGRKELESDRRLTASPGEYIWSQARKAGLWVRVYGEYVDVQEDHNSLNSPIMKADPEKWGYSAEWEKVFARGGRDTEKVKVFLDELAGWERSGKMPSLSVMALPDDHTHGFTAGGYSPAAMVACNDLAVGQLVEGLSRSRFWDSTAIFVIQDDAQDGPDHVDSHRTIGQFISPWVKRGTVDSNHYSTASMLRTIGLILGLKPLSSFDAHAAPMLGCVGTRPDLAAYSCQAPTYDVDERNLAKTALSVRSDELDWSDIDRVDPGKLNRILWEAYRPGDPYPVGLPGIK